MPDQPTVQQVVQDPDFHGLPFAEQMKVLKQVDPDFAGLPPAEQIRAAMGIQNKFAKQNMAKQPIGDFGTGQYLKNVAQVTPGLNMIPGIGTPDMATLQQFGSTLKNDVMGMGQALSPQSSAHPIAQGIANAVAPGLAQIPQLVQGDIQGRTDRLMQARQQSAQGDTTNAAISYTAGQLPMIGGMIPTKEQALQPGSAGIAGARGAELVAPEAIPKALKAIRGMMPKPLASATALDAAIPSKVRVNTAEKVATPEVTAALQDTTGRMKLTSADFTADNAPATSLKVIRQTLAEHNATFRGYLDKVIGPGTGFKVGQIMQALPEMSARVRGAIVDALRVDPKTAPLADRVESGQTDLYTHDAVRKTINQMNEGSYGSSKLYDPAMTAALKNLHGEITDNLYSQMEKWNGMKPGELRGLKQRTGSLMQLEQLMQKTDASVSAARTDELARTPFQKTADVVRKVNSLKSAEGATALASRGVGVAANTARLLRIAFLGH